MATSNYLKKLEEIKAKANGGSGGNSSPSGSSTTSSQSVLDRIKAKANGTSTTPESGRTEEKPSFTTKGNEGYNKYLEDMKASTTDKEDEKWWETLGRYLSGSTPDTSLPMATASQAASDIRADDSYRKPGEDWSVQQKSKFGELYLADPEAAYKYAEQANSENNKRKEESEANKIKESATENFGSGLGHTIGAIATAPLGAADYLKDLIYASEGRDITSDGTISPFEYSQAVTGGISEHFNEKGGTLDEDILIIGGKGWGDVYGLGTSIAQSMASAYTLGGVGTLISYFGQGAAAGVDDALSRGATDEQALLYGTAVGAFEGVAEKMGIDNLFKLGSASTVKGLLKNILQQAKAEGLEEGFTSLFSNIADNIIMQDKSVFNQTVAELMANGMSEKDAIKAAWWDSVEGIIFDTIAGSVSGSVSGGIRSTARTIKSNRKASKLYGDQAQTLVDDALGSQFSAVKEVGQKYQDKLGSGKSLSGWNLNELLEVTDNSKLKSSVMRRLGELGETTDGTPVAEVLVKYAKGEELSSKDYTILNNSDYGHQVLGGLNKENIMSGGLSNKWAENIGTRQVSPEVYNRSNATQQTPKKSKVNVLPSDDDENKMEISAEDVKTTITKDGKSVEVKVDKIESIEGDEISLKLDNGEVVNASDVDFGGQIGLVYQAAKDMTSRVGGFGIDAANVFVKGYTTDTKLTAAEYVHGFSDAYRFGKMGYPASELERGVYTSKLSKEQRETAYNFGKAFGNEEIAKKSEKIVSTVTINAENIANNASKKKKGRVHFDGSVAGKTLTEIQKASLKGLGVVAEAMGIDIHVFESKLVNGKRVGENGSYDPDTKEIRIDLHAGVKGDALMLFTASHELTHHIREVAPGKFKIFADALLEEYTKNGESVEKLIEQKKQFLEEKGRLEGKTEEEAYDLAYEEVVADSAEAMLVDSNAIEALSRKIHEKDKGLWNTIKSFIAKLVARIKAAYKGLNPDSAEANYVRDMVDSAERLQKLWVDALLEASDMVAVDTSTESVSPMFSERTWTASEYVIHRDNMAEKISNALGVTITKAKSYIDDINSIAKMIADDRTRLDYEASSFGSAFVSNVEYGGSFDYTTLCKKRRIYTGTFSEIQKRLHDVALTPDDILKIRNLLIEEGIEATCGLCYVEGSRANMGKFAKEFIRLYKRDNPDAWIPTMADVNTPDGVEQMRINHPEAYESYEYFWNHYGKLKDSDKALFASQQKPKLYEARKEYKGEILEHFKGDSTVAKKNLNGGIRMQSFSDFEIVHLIDTMQVIMDMSTVGLAGQAYTKVPEFAMAFGNTGLKINLSLIAKGVDADGNLIFDDREGMPHETAFGLRKKYSKNVGTIIVIFTDEQLLAAMADPRIDFIIPFHRSQWKKGQYGAMGLPKGTKDYTFMQNEKLIKQTYHEYQGRMVKDKASNYMPNEYWDFSKSGKENAEAYLKMCAENNKRPKFYKILDYDGNGTYSLKADGSTDGYWKLLIDFKMYDNDGVGSPQMAVTPTFNMDKARTMLDEYKGGHSKYPVASGVVDKFVNEYNKENKTKYSDRDSLDNYREKRYNLYTATGDFLREVAYNDRHAFARSLAYKTSGMADGEIRNIIIYSTAKVYVFRADGYMHGEMITSFSANNKQMLEDIANEYDKIDQSSENASLWAETFQSDEGGRGGNSGIYGRGRSDSFDTLYEDASGSHTSGDPERERPALRTKEEIDEIIKKLRDMYGFDAKNSDIRYSDRDSNEKKPRSAQAQRDAGYMLNEKKFEQLYSAHKVNLGNRFGESTEENIKSINETGLQHGWVLPVASVKPYRVGVSKYETMRQLEERGSISVGSAEEFKRSLGDRFGELDVEGWNKSYAPRKGEYIVLIPRNALNKEGYAVKPGFKPLPYEIVRADYDYQPYYEMYEKAYKNHNKDTSKYSDRDTYAPTFYSHMGKVIDDIKLEKMGTSSILNHLKNRGVKDEEIKWSGIEAFLEGKKSVTKAELQEFVAGSQLQIEEEMSGEENWNIVRDGDSYIVKDKNGKILETWEPTQDPEDPDLVGWISFGGGDIASTIEEIREYTSDWYGDGGSRWSQYRLDGGENYRELVFKMPDSTYSNNAMRGHWGQEAEGVLAHARIQDLNVNDKKMLFIEEIQSDWHNEGREKGYTTKEYEDAVEVYDRLAEDYANKRRAFNKYVRSGEFRSDPDEVSKKKFDWLRSKMETAEKRMQEAERDVESLKEKGMGDVPDAPFKNNYHEYVLKRLLRMAAEEGYDSIGWTTADIQSDRWSSDYAEGYRIEYDQDIPKFLRKYGKKWGATVGKTMLDQGWAKKYEARIASEKEHIAYWQNELSNATSDSTKDFIRDQIKYHETQIKAMQVTGETVWSMEISDSMKDSVLHEGQALYSDRNTASFKGKAFWSGSVSLLDGVIEEVHTMEEAEAVDFHHSMYFSPAQVEKMENGENAFFWVDDGKVQGDWRESVPKTIIKRIEEQIKVKYQDRNPDSYSNRSLLANALETAAQNDIERNKLKQYKQKIDLINAEEQKLHDLREQIKELSFKKGTRDTEAIKSLQFEANQAANRINTYDRQLLNLESTKALKGVLEREKAQARKRAEKQGKEALERYREKAAKTQRELMDRYQESRKRGVESRNKTAMRHKIKDVVNELNNYLLKGTKEKHIPIELQKVVAEALDAVNMDTVGANERIAKLKAEMLRAKTPEAMQEIAKKIDHIEEMGGNMEAKISRLKTAYDGIINSEDPLVANSHDEVISNTIGRVMEVVGDTPLRDMSLYQLEAVYDMYRMVLHSIRTANKAFKAKKSEEISVIANRVLEEIDKLKKKNPLRTKMGDAASNFDWNNLKPVYAFERIGSESFTEMFNNVRAGEDTWAVDMTEAQAFLEAQKKDHGYNSWDFKKRFEFTSSTGKKFELSLEQIMSLYAYAKRGDQAKDHLKNGGFVFDGLTEVKVKNKLGVTKTYQLKDATSYNISDEILAEITSKLSPEQKAFADAMQDYLSTTMGEKGNEVSLELYGVKLFKEKNYFPLKSAPQYLERAREQAQGDVKIKNKGFTKETAPKAKNPIVLTSFMDVWAGHVNEMSMYHAFTLALEDFYRVFNYKTPASETMDSEGVIPFIENAHGGAAVSYIDQLLKDLNGGARSDPRETVAKALMSRFKKTAVMGSLSVVVQQPTAIVRAMALVDAKYFGIAPITRGVVRSFNRKKHKALWEEVKKYAPVAIIKEMGYFDTGMGKSSEEWLKGEKTFMDKVDDVLAKAPAIADELAWISIWNAVKRETASKNPTLNTASEEFLKLAGERFTEVITKTQVYDSTLSKSSNMRSKSAFMNMWTSFMAEPTTTINMVMDAFRKGDKKYVARVLGATVGSIALNAALVSLVYAMRDDDEDETMTEKYLSRFTTELVDGINPVTYLPFFKDVWSLMQGFDIERADMSLINDLIGTAQTAFKTLTKDISDMSDDELSEHQKSVAEALWGIVDSITSLAGIPEKNIRRDINGVINLFKTLGRDMDTTYGSLMDNIGEDLKDSTPVWGWLPDNSKGDKLYDAIINGDTAYVDRIKSGYKTEKAYESAVRSALRENDSRIHEAAQARYDGDISEYTRIAKEIIAEGNFKQDDVVAAINSEISAIKKGEETEGETEEEKDEATSIYSASDINAAFDNGDNATALEIIDDLVKTKVANGKTEKEAKSSIRSSMTSYWKPLYKKAYESGNASEMARIRKILYASGLYGSANEVVKDVAAWLKD
jgi:hypothetical protein